MRDANSPPQSRRGCNGHGPLRGGPSSSGIQPTPALASASAALSLSEEGSHLWIAFAYSIL